MPGQAAGATRGSDDRQIREDRKKAAAAILAGKADGQVAAVNTAAAAAGYSHGTVYPVPLD